MEKYFVKSIKNEPFKLTKGSEELGSLNYPNLFNTTNAEIQLVRVPEKLSLRTTGRWKNRLELWEDDTCIASSKLGWNLGITCFLKDTVYFLKLKNAAKGLFVLQDGDNVEYIRIHVKMNWINAKGEFEIEVVQHSELFSPETLLFLTHNCTYFLALSGNGSGTEGVLAAII